jgi:hypothetical protein
MTDDHESQRSEAYGALEREIRLGRKFTPQRKPWRGSLGPVR